MWFLRFVFDCLFPPHERALRVRSLSYEMLATLVQPVRIASVDPPAVSLLPYRDSLVQAIITEAKFNNAHSAQEILGRILAEYLHSIEKEYPCVLVPVPLSRARLRERGYNQAECICRAAPMDIAIDMSLVLRIRDTIPQTQLGGRERRTNLAGAFTVARPPNPHTLYIVIDDVITTGATLSTVVAALKMAGAQHILPIALAHCP